MEWEKKRSIDVQSAIDKGLLKGNIFTHNHPRGRSLSGKDGMMMVEHGIAEIRAVGIKFIYSIQLPPDFTQHSILEFKKALEYIYGETRNHLSEDVNNNIYGCKEAALILDHLVWEKMNRYFLIKYRRIKNER